MEPDQQLRNLRDFLLVYNRMTEICFQRCTSNFNYRNLTMDEERCVDSCAGKLIRSNHRLMGTYVQLMPRMVQRRMEEMETKAKEMADAAAAAAAAPSPSPQVPPAAEALPASETPITSSPPAVLPSLANDVGQDAQGSVLKPARLGIPVDLGAAASKSTIATEVNLSAAAPFTPAAEAVVNGPSSYTPHFPQPPTAGAQTESVSSVATLIPSRSVSSSEDVPAPTVTTPTVSKSTEVPPVSSQ